MKLEHIAAISVISLFVFLTILSTYQPKEAKICSGVEKIIINSIIEINDTQIKQYENQTLELQKNITTLKIEINKLTEEKKEIELQNKIEINKDIKYVLSQTGKKEVLIQFDREIFLVGKDATTDYWRMKCATNSMKQFDCNDTIIAYKPTPKEVKNNSIIIFKAPLNEYGYKWFIHKVIKTDYPYYVTRGTNNEEDDGYIKYEDIYGKIWR